MGKQWKPWETLFSGTLKSLQMVTEAIKLKKHLLIGRKAVANLDIILESRDIPWLTKAHLVKGMFFPVVMYGCESWTVKKAECQRISAFELWCWRRLSRVPWTTRSTQSILKEINSEFSLEGLDTEAEVPILCPPDGKYWLIWKGLDAWKDWRQEEKGMVEDEMVGWHHWLNSCTWVWASSQIWCWTGSPVCCSPWDCKESGTTESWMTDWPIVTML